MGEPHRALECWGPLRAWFLEISNATRSCQEFASRHAVTTADASNSWRSACSVLHSQAPLPLLFGRRKNPVRAILIVPLTFGWALPLPTPGPASSLKRAWPLLSLSAPSRLVHLQVTIAALGSCLLKQNIFLIFRVDNRKLCIHLAVPDSPLFAHPSRNPESPRQNNQNGQLREAPPTFRLPSLCLALRSPPFSHRTLTQPCIIARSGTMSAREIPNLDQLVDYGHAVAGQ